MKVIINNKEHQTEAATLAALADELGLPATGVAVAVGEEMVPRTTWADYALTEGLQLIVIRAASGG